MHIIALVHSTWHQTCKQTHDARVKGVGMQAAKKGGLAMCSPLSPDCMCGCGWCASPHTAPRPPNRNSSVQLQRLLPWIERERMPSKTQHAWHAGGRALARECNTEFDRARRHR